jgi:hypothetical protein
VDISLIVNLKSLLCHFVREFLSLTENNYPASANASRARVELIAPACAETLMAARRRLKRRKTAFSGADHTRNNITRR